MSRWKSVLRAAAPITALLLLAAGARMLPLIQGKVGASEEESVLKASSTQEKSRTKPERTVKPAPAPLKPADAKTQALLQKVVSGQLTAFARVDFSLAMDYSSPEFRKMYTPDAFRQMVETGYAGLLTHKNPRYAPARCSGNIATMPVSLSGENGGEITYLYILRRGDTPLSSNRKAAGKATDEPGNSTGRDGDIWYIESVSPPGMGGYPGSDAPESVRITDIREL